MAQLTFTLPDEVRNRLAQRATASGFATAEAYAEALLLADAADLGAPPRLSFQSGSELESLLVARSQSASAGPMTRESFDQIRQRVLGAGTLPR